MAGEYQSPGGAFTNAVDDYLMQQAAQKHLQLMDSLAQKREDRLADAEMEAARERRDALKEHAQEAQDKLKEAKTNDFKKRVEGMVPGDIPDAEMLKTADELGVTGQYFPEKKVEVPGPSQTGGPLMQSNGIRAYVGNRQDREKAIQDEKVKAISDQMAGLDPNSPDFKRLAVQYEMLAGKPIPAAMTGAPKSGLEPVMTREQALKLGQVPAGTKIIEPLQPKDTSARDDREAKHRDDVYKVATTDLDKMAAPMELHKDAINQLGTVMNQHTREADTLIAPLVLKATVSGTGSGFRMTRPELEKVAGGRDKWSSLELALNQWSADPSKPLEISEEQRTELRQLAKAIRKKAVDGLARIDRVRHSLDDMDDPRQIQKAISGLRSQMHMDDDDTTDDTSAPAGVPAVGGTFQGGKVLKVTPIPSGK